MFNYENSYPYSSCYTEPDLRYISGKSESLSFNQSRFLANSFFMGIRQHCNSKEEADVLESMYYVENKRHYGNHEGTRVLDANYDPFFYRCDNELCFTIPAIFAGRDDDRLAQSVRESCSAVCFNCDVKVEDEQFSQFSERIYGGTILGFGGERFEVLCKDCFNTWVYGNSHGPYHNENRIHDSYSFGTKEQISFTRFILQQADHENVKKVARL